MRVSFRCRDGGVVSILGAKSHSGQDSVDAAILDLDSKVAATRIGALESLAQSGSSVGP